MNELTQKAEGFFQTNNDIVDVYAKKTGAIGLAVYVHLRRHLNKEKNWTAWPTQKQIARELRLSERAVIRYIKILKRVGLIKQNKQKRLGRWANSTYYFPKTGSVFSEPYDSESYGNNLQPYDKKSINHMTQSHIKNTNIKNTKGKELSEEQRKQKYREMRKSFVLKP